MKHISNKVIFLLFIVSFLLSCAKPTVVEVSLPEDKNLNCNQLEDAIAEAQHLKRKAERAKDGTGGNVSRMMLFWPAWAKTLHNADVAIEAADDRIFHLINIMKKKNCKGVDNINSELKETKNNQVNITEQLRDLKDMFDSGVLTEEEYEMAKQKVLKP
jgi:hypothetical protein